MLKMSYIKHPEKLTRIFLKTMTISDFEKTYVNKIHVNKTCVNKFHYDKLQVSQTYRKKGE